MNANSTRPWWDQVLRGERSDLVSQSLRRFAEWGSWGYEAGVRSRTFAYERGWLKSRRLPHPTICVGNLTVGGTGKTPLVARLASDLLAGGLRPAILLRGYKRRRPTKAPVFVRSAEKILADIDSAGDEAMELAFRLPGSVIGVGADRYDVGRHLLERAPIDCFILDDGFQHHRLKRDFNIVAIDANDPWGGGKLLPAGLLREKPEALRRADAVVLTRSNAISQDRLSVLRAQIAHWLPSAAAIMESTHEADCLTELSSRRVRPLSELRGRKVFAASAIGNPASFEHTLEALGADVQAHLHLRDHTGRAEQVWRWLRERRRNEWLVITEKDAMRWSGGSLPDHVFVLRMNLHISGDARGWQRLIEWLIRRCHGR